MVSFRRFKTSAEPRLSSTLLFAMTLTWMLIDNDETDADIFSNASVWHTTVTSPIKVIIIRRYQRSRLWCTIGWESKLEVYWQQGAMLLADCPLR